MNKHRLIVVAAFVALLTPSWLRAGATASSVSSQNAVTSITGTAGQITASAATGAVTLSLPTALTGINSITAASATDLVLNGGATSGNVVINTNGSTLAATFSGANTALAGNLTVSGAGGIAVAGSAALSGYSNVNSGGLSSTTALNPGILVFGGGAGTSQYGMDLGYNGNYRTRIFSPGDVVISNVNAIPTGQSSFTDKFTFSTITGNFTASGTVIGSAGISIDTAGATLSVKSGANAASGTVTLAAGTATITSTTIDTNTVIIFSEKTAGGTPGVYQPLAAVSTGSATVTSAATDTSTYNWIALKVAP